MKDVNKIFLIGRLGADPAVKETRTGVAMVTFPVATKRRYGEDKEEETQWHRVLAWGKQADHCRAYLAKGNSVHVEGSLRLRKYVGKDNISRLAVEVLADNVTFLTAQNRRPKAEITFGGEDGVAGETSEDSMAGDNSGEPEVISQAS